MRIGEAFARPRMLAVACIVMLTGLGWLYCGVEIGRSSGFVLLCRPINAGVRDFALVASMWCAMTFAMMLPSAGPMILTYTEIAETAAGKGMRVVSPLVLASGYLSIWILFSVAAAFAQVLFANSLAPVAIGPLSGALVIGAGLYQFTPLKQACLNHCQRPFPFFFANWKTTQRGVFQLGLKQGVYCLGCCWAIMAVMLAVGAMSVIWMAALAVVMTIEKMSSGKRFSQLAGVALILAGAAIIAIA